MYTININSEDNIKKLKKGVFVQSLPAKMQYDGKANVQKHFNIYSKKQDDHLINTLRGHLLQGKTFEIPQNLQGIIFKGLSGSQKNVDKMAYVDGTFDEFTLWNYDALFPKSDVCTKIWNLSKLSNSLLVPVEENDLEEFDAD